MLSPRRILPRSRALLALLLGSAGLLGAVERCDAQTMLNILAQAKLSYADPVTGAVVASDSNRVEAQTPEAVATLGFFASENPATQVWTTQPGKVVLPRLRVSGCNADPLTHEILPVTLRAQLSQDSKQVHAHEVEPNAGTFELRSEVVTRLWQPDNPPLAHALDVLPGDVVDATASDCKGGVVKASLRMEPRAFVFDAESGQPLAGVLVRLIDVSGNSNGGKPGAPAVVYLADGVTPVVEGLVTDADGGYVWPFLVAGQYRVTVTPGEGHSFPAVKTVNNAPRTFALETNGASFGEVFSVDARTNTAIVNLPLDPLVKGLSVQKTSSRATVEVAESLEYVVTVKNVGQRIFSDVTLKDTLPVGFRYVAGTSRLDGQAVGDPSGGAGPRLEWAIGDRLPAAASHTLRYRVRVGTGALQGDGVNRAQAFATAPEIVASNLATAKVRVEAGVFSDRGIVMGTVYADCDADGLKGLDEPGVPGVRLWMEDGTSVLTDSAGRYSLYGLSPRTHVFKLDPLTLPAGAMPLASAQRNAGDGRSRFVDLGPGELQRADFALGGCSATMREEIARRVIAAGKQAEEITGSLRTSLSPTTTAAPTDVRALPASGRLGETGAAPLAPGLAGGTASAGGSFFGMAPIAMTPKPVALVPPDVDAAVAALAAAAAAVPSVPASAPVASPDPTSVVQPPVVLPPVAVTEDAGPLPHFVGLRDGDVLPSSTSAVKVAGHAGTRLSLLVNGEPVPDDRLAEREVFADPPSETRLYLGLALRPGDNRLTLIEHDAFGQRRATRELTVRVAGELARIVIEAPPTAATGATVPVRLRFEDARGLPVPARLPVTLAGAGRWTVEDLDPRQPELQTFVAGGGGVLDWIAPEVPGEARLRVLVNGLEAESRIAVSAALRPLIAVGVVETTLNLRRTSASGSGSGSGSGDGFEQQLRAYSGDARGTEARGAVFIKGEVYRDTLLTLAFDSKKDAQERLFRDIQPDAFYPVYGDASVRSFDAQSTGRLYARIDHRQSWLLLGDYTTQSDDPIRQLGVYQRSLNGLKQHLEIGGLKANAFAARDNTRQQLVELRGNGTSGPFAIGADLVPNSEKVELIVRDRNQPALIVSTTTKERYLDYDLEPITGRLLMRAPVPSVDADLNPVFLRVTYEVEQGGPSFWVAGVDAQWQATETLSVGGSLVKDWNPMAPMRMGSANAKLALGERTALSAELARIEREDSQVDGTAAHAGNAERLQFTHDGEDLKARLHAARSDVGFDNRSSMINSGRAEGGAQASYRLDERTRLAGEAMFTSDVASGAKRVGVLVGVERALEGGAKVELGVRHVRDLNAPGTPAVDADGRPLDIQGGTTTSVRGKVGMPVPGLPLATVFLEGEQDLRDSGKRLLAVGGDYQLAGRGRAYLRHELVSSLSGPYSLDPTVRRNTTVLGIDAGTDAVGGEGRVFSEYRGREAFSGRETEAAIGLRNQWQLRPGLRLNATLERVQALRGGTGENQSTAATAAIDYTADPRWKGTARLELREGGGSTGLLSTVGVAIKLDEQWTLLGRNVLAGTLAHGRAQPDRWQERLQLGVAYRGRDNRVNALGRYEYKDERGTLGDVDSRRAHVVSAHAERQVGQGVAVTGRYAAKLVDERFSGLRERTVAQLGGVRLTRDLGPRWDVGVAASVMGDLRLRSRQTSIGAELGYRARENLWISVGFNARGFRDRDLSADDATARGVYLRLRFKFDENLFSRSSS